MKTTLNPKIVESRYFFTTYQGEKKRFKIRKQFYYCALKNIELQAQKSITDLSTRALGTYAIHCMGLDSRERLSRSTWYKHRNEILQKLNIDIATRDPDDIFLRWLSNLISARKMKKEHRNFSDFVSDAVFQKICDPNYLQSS